MFDCLCVFVNGNMAGGIHEGRWIVRFRPAKRKALLASGGSEFAPMGRVMKEYATLPQGVVADPSQLRQWLSKSFAYARSLPAMSGKARSGRSKQRPKTGA